MIHPYKYPFSPTCWEMQRKETTLQKIHIKEKNTIYTCILAILRLFGQWKAFMDNWTPKMLKCMSLFQNLSSCSIYIPDENPGILSIPHLRNSLKDLQFIATFFRVQHDQYDQKFESSFESSGAPHRVSPVISIPLWKSKVRNAGSRKRSPSYVHCASSNPAIGFERDIYVTPPEKKGWKLHFCYAFVTETQGWEQNKKQTGKRKISPPKKVAWQLCDLALVFVDVVLIFSGFEGWKKHPAIKTTAANITN